MLAWSCPDECRYDCMHEQTAARVAAGKPVQQYFGKWPFLRLGAVQEPAAVLFSVLNLLAHLHGIRRLRRVQPCGGKAGGRSPGAPHRRHMLAAPPTPVLLLLGPCTRNFGGSRLPVRRR
eukprot:SAG22_NODE_5469_length_1008_cov_1.246425_2_plen_120_part_00